MVKETMQSVDLPIRELKVRMYKVVHEEILTSAVSIFNFPIKNPTKIACFYYFFRKNQFLPLFYPRNGHFSIFVDALTL